MPIKRTLSSIKKAHTAHPNSRKARQVTRAVLRSDRLASKQLDTSQSKHHVLVNKLTWFQLQLDPANPGKTYTKDQVNAMIADYISRNDEEIQNLVDSTSRVVPKKLALLEELKRQEEKQHSEGQFEMVDLGCAANLRAFLNWNGDYNAVGLLKMAKYKK